MNQGAKSLIAIAALASMLFGGTVLAAGPTQVPVPPTFADVAYGHASLQTLDFWQAKTEKPAPLLVIIHGGGWVHGDKNTGLGGNQRFLDRGISVASINYRLAPANPLPSPVMDAARAVQFLRMKAKEWNLDARRVIAMGDSAGGCSALWLATHDDLANPTAVDPVERQSTRLLGAVALNAQTTIEPDKIREMTATPVTQAE